MGTPSSPGIRLRGRKAVAQRKRRLLRTYGLCEHCKAKGIIRPADVVDHITPLMMGGSDEDENTQNLCDPHHAEKTALDGVNPFAASYHPEWLKPSAIPLTIISGPPASGKTTYVNERAGPHDIVVCLDTIMMELRPTYQHWRNALDPALINKAIRLRNARLGNLAKEKHGRAWFIVSAPSKAERDWWHRTLGGETILLHPGADECKRRAEARGTPKALAGIDAWEKASRSPWLPPKARKAKKTIGEDGWPVQE